MKTNVEMKVGHFLIRTIQESDIEAVRRLRNSARESFLVTTEISEEAQRTWYATYAAKGDDDLMFVMLRGETIVAMAGLARTPDHTEFGRLVVDESERRNGIGFVLTAKLMAWAFSVGRAKTIGLNVKADNVSAISLYTQLGFKRTGRPVGGDVLWMEATSAEVETWQNWDRPGVAEQIVSYWGGSPSERAHKAWLADVVYCGAQAGSLLEAGCGSGDIYAAVRDYPQMHGQMYRGVDTSRAMLAVAKAAHPHAHFEVGDLRQLPPSSADTVVCFDVLGHLPGDLVPELRSIIGAARETAIVALWTAKNSIYKSETVAGIQFLHNHRTHADMLKAIHTAVPDCRVVQHRGYGENIAYVIKPFAPLTHSVIIGSYNRPTYVQKAIRSVMEQSYSRWEIIVTDDGSTEETLAAIRDAFGGDSRCRLIVATDKLPEGPRPSGNVRAVERINDAIPLVTGDIVHYLPDDDWFLPGRFEAFNAAFVDPTVMMAYGIMKYADGDTISATDAIYPGHEVTDPWCQLDQTQVAHRRACFEKVPLWSLKDIGYAADGVFYRDLCKAGYGPVRPFATPVSVHRRHTFNLQKGQQNATDRREG